MSKFRPKRILNKISPRMIYEIPETVAKKFGLTSFQLNFILDLSDLLFKLQESLLVITLYAYSSYHRVYFTEHT